MISGAIEIRMYPKTKRRMFKRLKMKAEEHKAGTISLDSYNQTIQSYKGFLKHANAYAISSKLKNLLFSDLPTRSWKPEDG